MSVREAQLSRSQAISRVALVLVFIIIAGLAVLWPCTDPDAVGASAPSGADLESAGYEDTVARLMAGVWDSSLGPTVVAVDGAVEPAPGSSDGDVTLNADHSQIDVDSRSERTASADRRASAIARSVAMTSAGLTSVARLIAEQRDLEAAATASSSGTDIVAMTVKATDIAAEVTETGATRVTVTLRVAQEYREGVISEGDETAVVTFEPDTGEVVSADLLTGEDLAP